MSGRDVLERNLTRLLCKAYHPVLPRASFREGLRADFLARAARLGSAARPPAAPRRRLPWRPALGLAAAAAAALAVALGPWWGPPAGDVGLDSLLARGELAWRAAPASGWSESSAAALEFAGGFLELVTPAARGVKVDAGADRLELEAASNAVLRGDAALRALAALGELNPPGELNPYSVLASVDLRRGALLVERGAAPPLELETGEGRLSLEAGRARLEYEGAAAERAVRVRVERGRALVAAFAADPERWVEAGQEVLLRGGRVVGEEPAGGLAAVPSGGRQQVEPAGGAASPDEPPADGASGEPAGSVGAGPFQVAGTVALVPTGDGSSAAQPAEDFQVIFLRQVALPDVAEPQVFGFSAAAGRFELGGLEPGLHQVFARAPGYALWRGGERTIGPPGDAALELEPALELEIELSRGVRVEGLVVDERTGLPIPGALVVSVTDAPVQILSLTADEYPPDLLSLTRTGTDGGFVLADLSDTEHVLRASAPGYGPTWEGPRHPAQGPFELSLAPAGRIEGRVLDAAGAPVEQSLVIVSLTDFGASHPVMTYAPAVTDAAGHYALGDLPAGFWPLLSFGAVGALDRMEPELAFVRVAAGQATQHDFAAERAGVRLEGVLSRSDGTPAARRAVWLTPASHGSRDMVSTSTDAEGRFRFEGLAPAHYALFTSQRSPADMIVLGQVDLSSGADVLDHRVQLSSAALTGQVQDGLEGGPLEFAVVVLLRVDGPVRGFAGKAITDREGRFRFQHAEEGSYEIQVVPTRQVYGAERLGDLVLVEGRELDLGPLLLHPGGALELAVTDPEGRPAAGVAVLFRFEDGHAFDPVEDAHTGPDGRLLAPALKTGRWRLELSGQEYVPRAVDVHLERSDEVQRVTVELERR